MGPGTFGKGEGGRGGGGWVDLKKLNVLLGAYNRMYVLFTGRRAYSGGGGRGGAMVDPDLQVRGGDGHSVPEKKGMEPFQKKNLGAKIKEGGGGAVLGLLPWIRH